MFDASKIFIGLVSTDYTEIVLVGPLKGDGFYYKDSSIFIDVSDEYEHFFKGTSNALFEWNEPFDNPLRIKEDTFYELKFNAKYNSSNNYFYNTINFEGKDWYLVKVTVNDGIVIKEQIIDQLKIRLRGITDFIQLNNYKRMSLIRFLYQIEGIKECPIDIIVDTLSLQRSDNMGDIDKKVITNEMNKQEVGLLTDELNLNNGYLFLHDENHNLYYALGPLRKIQKKEDSKIQLFETIQAPKEQKSILLEIENSKIKYKNNFFSYSIEDGLALTPDVVAHITNHFTWQNNISRIKPLSEIYNELYLESEIKNRQKDVLDSIQDAINDANKAADKWENDDSIKKKDFNIVASALPVKLNHSEITALKNRVKHNQSHVISLDYSIYILRKQRDLIASELAPEMKLLKEQCELNFNHEKLSFDPIGDSYTYSCDLCGTIVDTKKINFPTEELLTENNIKKDRGDNYPSDELDLDSIPPF